MPVWQHNYITKMPNLSTFYYKNSCTNSTKEVGIFCGIGAKIFAPNRPFGVWGKVHFSIRVYLQISTYRVVAASCEQVDKIISLSASVRVIPESKVEFARVFSKNCQ